METDNMATLNKLMEGRKPGEIKVCKDLFYASRYFVPYFLTRDGLWYGMDSEGTPEAHLGLNMSSTAAGWHLYTAPKPKVKRALHVIVPLDGKNQPWLYSNYCKDEDEVQERLKVSLTMFKFIRLPETERDFDE
jgi:hypothetical protein